MAILNEAASLKRKLDSHFPLIIGSDSLQFPKPSLETDGQFGSERITKQVNTSS